MKKTNIAYLGGTVDSSWRGYVISKIKMESRTFEVKNDLDKKMKYKECNYHVYVVTPNMKGFSTIAYVMESAFKLPKGHTVFCYLNVDSEGTFTQVQKDSLKVVNEILRENGAVCCENLDEVIEYLNSRK